MATASPPAGQPAARVPFGARLHNFWRRVTEGLEVSQLWSQFESEARTSYRLYSRDVEAKTPEGLTRRGRRIHVVKEFFWAVFEKLSPARRVLLLLALIFLVIPHTGFEHTGEGGKVYAVEFDLHFWAALLLLLLLVLEIADRVVMKRDLQIAREIQTWLLPGAPPQIPGLVIAYATRPANTVAGDYYDVFPRPGRTNEDNRVVLAVADVAGKSIPAAMLMATFQASLKTLSTAQVALPELASNMNRYACTNSQGGLRFTTAFLAEYDPTRRTLDYINAGHNNPILRRASGQIERLDVCLLYTSHRPHQPVMSRMRVNQYHQIVRESCILDVGVLTASRGGDRLFQHPVHLREVEVTEQWRNHPALRNSLLPGHLQHHLEQMHDLIILYPSRHLL